MRTIEPFIMSAMRDALERQEDFAQVPYIPHPMKVCRLVLECGGSQIAGCAAVLHEVVGRGCMTLDEVAQRYSQAVASLVQALATGQAEGDDEAALLVCADRTDHLLSRAQMGLADGLSRDINTLHLALLRLGAQARRVLTQELDALLPALAPGVVRRPRRLAGKSVRRRSPAA